MTALLQTVVIILLALTAARMGYRLAGADRRLYWSVVAVALATILVVAAAWWDARWVALPGLAWLCAGQHKLIAIALAGPVLQVALLARLKKRSERVLVATFLTIVVARVAVLPPAMAAAAVPELSALTTQVDSQGVCIQSTGYTCGPAAAVTVLRRLGIQAEEGELGILAGTNVMSGTDAGNLAQAIEERYGDQGVTCTYRHFHSVEELCAAGPTIVIVSYPSGIDHCLAVLGVSDRQVLTGDPLLGIHPYWRADFERVWHFSGIVVRRRS